MKCQMTNPTATVFTQDMRKPYLQSPLHLSTHLKRYFLLSGKISTNMSMRTFISTSYIPQERGKPSLVTRNERTSREASCELWDISSQDYLGELQQLRAYLSSEKYHTPNPEILIDIFSLCHLVTTYLCLLLVLFSSCTKEACKGGSTTLTSQLSPIHLSVEQSQASAKTNLV